MVSLTATEARCETFLFNKPLFGESRHGFSCMRLGSTEMMDLLSFLGLSKIATFSRRDSDFGLRGDEIFLCVASEEGEAFVIVLTGVGIFLGGDGKAAVGFRPATPVATRCKSERHCVPFELFFSNICVLERRDGLIDLRGDDENGGSDCGGGRRGFSETASFGSSSNTLDDDAATAVPSPCPLSLIFSFTSSFCLMTDQIGLEGANC